MCRVSVDRDPRIDEHSSLYCWISSSSLSTITDALPLRMHNRIEAHHIRFSLRCCISSNSHNAFSHSLILKVCIRCIWWWLFCKMFLTDEFLDLKGDHVCFWTPIACPGIIATKNRGTANYFRWYWAKKPSDVSDGGLFVKYFLQMSFWTWKEVTRDSELP